MPKDYIIWIALLIGSVVWFGIRVATPTLPCIFIGSISVWATYLSYMLLIKGMKLAPLMKKLIPYKILTCAIILVSIASGVHLYALMQNNAFDIYEPILPSFSTGTSETTLTGDQQITYSGNQLSGNTAQTGSVLPQEESITSGTEVTSGTLASFTTSGQIIEPQEAVIETDPHAELAASMPE